MRSSIPFSLIAFLLVAMLSIMFSLGCSGVQDPAIPDSGISSGPEQVTGQGDIDRVVWSVFDLLIDPESQEVQVILDRDGAAHYNVTAFLLPPNCSDCVKALIQGVDLAEHIYTIKVILKNPTALTGYDVRGIIRFFSFDNRELMNPDDYTKLFDDSEPADINPFKAFAKEEPSRKFDPDISHDEIFEIRFPPPVNFLVNYVVDASWPNNQKEPYEITDQSTDGNLDEIGTQPVEIACNVRDWQNDIEYVNIDLSPLGFPGEVEFNHGAGNHYFVSITNDYGATPGDYQCLISAKSFDNKWLIYDYLTISVEETPEGPPEWVGTVGILSAVPGDGEVTVTYGVAIDPDIPVHYNIYWSTSTPIDFGTANKEIDVDGSPYVVNGLTNGQIHFFAVRAEDALGYEDDNTKELSATPTFEPEQEWVFKTLGVINSSPAFWDMDGDDIQDVIIGSEDTNVYCLSGVNGAAIWTFPCGNWVDSSPALAVEVTAGETPDVIIGSYDHFVYRIDGGDGTKVWGFDTGDIVHASAALADLNGDNNLDAVVGNFNGDLYAIDGVDGSEIWTYSAGGAIYSSAALGDINGDEVPDCFVGARDNKLHVVDGATGDGLWTFTTGDWVNGSPALGYFDDDMTLDAVFTSLDGKLYVVSGETHEEIWNFPTGDKCQTSPSLGFIDDDFIVDVVFGSDDHTLYAVSGIDGSQIWAFSSEDRIWSSAALAEMTGDDVVDAVVGSDDFRLYLVDGASGDAIWEIETGNWIDSSPCVGDPDNDDITEIAVGGFDGFVYLISSAKPYPEPDMIPWPKFRRDVWNTGLLAPG